MSISRRDALMGAGAAAVVAGVPGAVQGDPVEPLLAMEQEWLQLRDQYETAPDVPHGAPDPLFDKLLDLQYRIHLTEAKSPAGVAVKLRMYCRNNCWDEADFVEVTREDTVRGAGNLEVLPLKAALHDLERLAGDFERLLGGMRP